MPKSPVLNVVIVCVLVLTVPFLGSTILRKVSERKWRQLEAEAKAAGVPLTPGEALKDYPSIPDSQNAAVGAKETLRMVLAPPQNGTNEFQGMVVKEFDEAHKAIQAELDGSFEKKKKIDIAVLEKNLRPFKEPLSEFEKAMAKPGWNFERQWEQGIMLLLPDLARFKMMGRLLRAKAIVAAARGEVEVARQSFLALGRLGTHLMTEPNSICVLVGASCRDMAYRTALEVARLRPTDVAFLRQIQRIVSEFTTPIAWKRLWRNEQASQLVSLEYFTTMQGMLDWGYKAEDRPAPRSVRLMMDVRTRLIPILIEADKAWQGKPDSAATLEEIATKYEGPIQDQLAGFSDVFHGAGGWEGAQFARHVQVRDAKNILIYLVLETIIEGFKRPAKLTEKQWLDPFSKAPMKFRTTPSGFSIYSVGNNKVDDGGQFQPTNDDPLDIVVSYP